MPPSGPFVPTVPFPAASARPVARPGLRAETDPLDRAETVDGSAETYSHERQEDSALARLDTTGVISTPLVTGDSASFESATAEVQSFASDDQVETHSRERVQPTDLDLPVAKPPPEPVPDVESDADAEAEADADAEAEAEAAAAAMAGPPSARAPSAEPEPPVDPGAPKPKDRLARGLRAFGIKPTERDGTGMFKLSAAAAKDARAESEAEAAAASAASPAAAKVPISTAPSSLPPPSEKQSTTSGPSPACPQCESPMAWVEEHLRFYCKSCKMYF